MIPLHDSLMEYIKLWDNQHENNIIKSIPEALWEIYSMQTPVDDGRIREKNEILNPVMAELSLTNADALCEMICDLCLAYQRSAFLDGFAMGVKLGIGTQQS